MRHARQVKLIRDAIEANARRKFFRVHRHRLQHSEAAGAAAHDHGALRINAAFVNQMLLAADGIFDIADAPIAAQLQHVVAAVAGAAAIVDREHCEAARREKLNLGPPRGEHLARRSAMHPHDQRRLARPFEASARRRDSTVRGTFRRQPSSTKSVRRARGRRAKSFRRSLAP